MDNRWSNRKDLYINVDIYQHGDKLATGRSRDVGLGGAYLDSVRVGNNLRIDTQVELVFHLVEGTRPTSRSLRVGTRLLNLICLFTPRPNAGRAVTTAFLLETPFRTIGRRPNPGRRRNFPG